MRRLLVLTAALFLLQAQQAHADPCEAIPEGGPMPASLRFGATFEGPVVHVIDGDSLCVAVGPGHENWVEVRLGDFYAAEASEPGGPAARAALERLALGRKAVCVASLGTHDRIAARCRIDGRPLGEMLRAAGVSEGGRAAGLGAPRTRAGVSMPARSPVSASAFRSCDAARAAGAAPVHRGHPGYNPNLDGDQDGIACEPIRGR